MNRIIIYGLFIFLLNSYSAAADLVLAPGQALEQAALERMLCDALAKRGVAGPLALDIEQPSLPLANNAASPISLMLVALSHEPSTGRYRAQINATLDSGISRVIAVSGRAQELIDVIYPVRTINAGEIIDADDLKIISAPASSLVGDHFHSINNVIGLEAKRALLAGKFIRVRDLGKQVMVRRGEVVRLVFVRGSLELTAEGMALEDGQIGQNIRISNEISGQLRYGNVVGQNLVHLIGGSR